MTKFFSAVALMLGLLFAAPAAFASGHGHPGGGHQTGGHYSGGHYNGGHYNGGHYNGGIGIYVGPSYRHYPLPYPAPRPYPYPYPTPGAITVLVTDYCYGRVYTHYVTAYWNNYYGGYWYYDCAGNYRRAR